MSESVSQHTLLATLKRVFGYDAFRPGQEGAGLTLDQINSLLNGMY